MIRLDTLRVRLPQEFAGLDAAALTRHPETLNDDRRRSSQPRHLATLSGSDSLGFGFGRIVWDRLRGMVSLDCSAKALRNGYPEGITVHSLDQLADGLNRSGLVHLTPEALTSADVLWADAAVDLAVGRDAVADDFKALRILRTNMRHQLREQGKASLLWKGPKGQNLRVYDKEAELWKASNRPFLQTLTPDTARRFRGVVRFEREARGPARARQFASVGIEQRPATLREILSSTRAPVAELFDQVRGTTGQRELFERSDALVERCPHKPGRAAVRWLLERLGMLTVCEASGWEFDAVRDWLRTYGGSHASRFYDDVREEIILHHAGPAAEERAVLFHRLDTLSEALRAAA